MVAGRLPTEIEHHLAVPLAAGPTHRLSHYIVSFGLAWARVICPHRFEWLLGPPFQTNRLAALRLEPGRRVAVLTAEAGTGTGAERRREGPQLAVVAQAPRAGR